MKKNKNNNSVPKHQAGAASLVFVVLLSVVMMANTTEVFNNVKNTQQIGTAVNAMTHAETATWTAAEAFRLYLEDIDSTELLTLQSTIPMSVDSVYGSLSAEDVSVTEVSPDVFQVQATLVNRHAASHSSSKVQMFYSISSSVGTSDGWSEDGVVTFTSDLTLSGSITLSDNGNPVDLTVDGDVNLSNASINQVDKIKTTGSVTLGSNVNVNEIYADDDVTLANTQANLVRTMGDFTATGSAAVSSVQANGDITIQSNGDFDDISTPRNIFLNGSGKHGLLLAGEAIQASNSNGIISLSAIGDIQIQTSSRVDQAISMGNITCPGTWWRKSDIISANGTLTNCASSNGAFTATANASNTVLAPAQITPITIATPVIDVWAIKDEANYFVWWDSVTSRIMVTVNSVNGLIDGTDYRLADFSTSSGASYRDYLCTSVNGSGNCIAPSSPTLPLCFGYSLGNNCISYNNSTKTFSFAPNTTAPGVMFFDGNVLLKDGHSMTTILASGNIKTQGEFKLSAANFGGYAKICAANADHAAGGVRARYTDAYSDYYPTNLCDVDNSIYTPTSTANIGLAAGGVNPDLTVNPSADYTGGDIDLGASTIMTGAVLAGNTLKTSGQVVITGLVATTGLGADNSNGNSLGSSTTIDFASSGDYDSTDLPDMTTTATGPLIKSASVLWSRPL